MTKEEFAARINGREYGRELTSLEAKQAKELGLVIVYGASDDLMEFEGAICDDVDCYRGGTAYLDKYGLWESKCEDDDCPYAEKERDKCKTIRAVRCKDDIAWTYETDIPHATFDIIEDDIIYCRGIVFHMDELGKMR